MSRGWGSGVPSWVKLDFVVWCRLGKILYLSFRRVIHTLSLEKDHLFSDGRFLLLIYLFLPRWTLSYDCSRFVASILGLWQGCDDVFCVLSRCSTLACISSEDCRLVFRETTVSEIVSVCCSLGTALCQPSPNILLFGGCSFIPAGHRVLHGELIYWTLVDTEASSVVQPHWAQMLVGHDPHPTIATASGLWITKGKFPHLVSDCHWGWNVPFLQCKEQRHPVHERLPSENRATCHAGYLPLPFTLRSFHFFSINKVQEEIMQSCIELVRLELEITEQTQQWWFGWDLNVHSFIHSFVFIHIFIPSHSFITGVFTQMFSRQRNIKEV